MVLLVNVLLKTLIQSSNTVVVKFIMTLQFILGLHEMYGALKHFYFVFCNILYLGAKARLVEGAVDDAESVGPSTLRKQAAIIADDPKYKGKRASRKDLYSDGKLKRNDFLFLQNWKGMKIIMFNIGLVVMLTL